MIKMVHQQHDEFFAGLNELIILESEIINPLSSDALLNGNNWRKWPLGRSGFHLSAARTARNYPWPHVALSLGGSDAKRNFDALYRDKTDIQQELGDNLLDWDRQNNNTRCLIRWHARQFNPDDDNQWKYQQRWLLYALEEFHRVFAPRILGSSRTIEIDKLSNKVDKGLISAVFRGESEEVTGLLKAGANPNAPDDAGYTALAWAVSFGDIDVIIALLNGLANLNVRNQHGSTPLDIAISKENLEVVEVLLKYSANPYQQNTNASTPLISAVLSGNAQLIRLLISKSLPERNVDVLCEALQYAAHEGYKEMVEVLLEAGADPDEEGIYGQTSLVIASSQGHKEIIELICQFKQRSEISTKQGIVNSEAQKIREDNSNTILAELIAELYNLTGLFNIKSDLKQFIDYRQFQKMRQNKGLMVPNQSLHLIFTGNPGTGKTTIARLLGKLYQSLGVLSKGHFIEVSRSHLVGGYLGQTAIKTHEIIESAIGGVLFIDEAYSLTENEHGKDSYGDEAVATLLKLMEDNRDDLVVIVAGYTEPMQKFIRSNPGLQSRFNKFLHFDDYSPSELVEIFKSFAAQSDYKLSAATELKLGNVFANLYRNRDETFGNARLARNLFEKAINNHASRMVTAGMMDEESLVTLQPEDISV